MTEYTVRQHDGNELEIFIDPVITLKFHGTPLLTGLRNDDFWVTNGTIKIYNDEQRFLTVWERKSQDAVPDRSNRPLHSMDGDPVGVQRRRRYRGGFGWDRLTHRLGRIHARARGVVMPTDSEMTQDAEGACCGGCLIMLLVLLGLAAGVMKVML
jgi:hypothetical protein